METMGTWDLTLLVVVSYLAVSLLVRLMLAHRHRVVRQLREQTNPLQRENIHNQKKKAAS